MVKPRRSHPRGSTPERYKCTRSARPLPRRPRHAQHAGITTVQIIDHAAAYYLLLLPFSTTVTKSPAPFFAFVSRSRDAAPACEPHAAPRRRSPVARPRDGPRACRRRERRARDARVHVARRAPAPRPGRDRDDARDALERQLQGRHDSRGRYSAFVGSCKSTAGAVRSHPASARDVTARRAGLCGRGDVRALNEPRSPLSSSLAFSLLLPRSRPRPCRRCGSSLA